MRTKIATITATTTTTTTNPCNPLKTKPQPTSLPVSERLRFFTNLAEAANRSASNSYTRSPPQHYFSTDRCGSANSYTNQNSFTFTPRSSLNGSGSTSNSSASVTPTPMECYSPPLLEPQLISINEIDSALQMEEHNDDELVESAYRSSHQTSAFIKLTKSSSQTLLPSVLAHRLDMSAPAPATAPTAAITSPDALTPVARRIKMKTIGKLLLPQTFLNNERNSNQHNNNNNSSNNNYNNNNMSGSHMMANGSNNDTCDSECSSIDLGSKPPPQLKKIGKIKSPFIENCLQMQQKHHQLNSKCMKYDHKSTPHNNALAALENNVANGGGGGGERDVNSLPLSKSLQNGNAAQLAARVNSNEDNNADSGKENNYCDTQHTAPLLILSPSASGVTEQTRSPVVEMRKKFSRIMSNASLSALMLQRHTTHAVSGANDSGSAAIKLNGSANNSCSSGSSASTTPRNSIIDEKFAKYFGLTSNAGSHNQRASTAAANNNATSNGSARLLDAGEKSATLRSAPKYPPLPPPDFCHTMNGASFVSALTPMETSSAAHSTPLEALNHHVRSSTNIAYYTPPTASSYETTNGSAAGHAASSVTSTTASQRRRDMAKRQRAHTTNVTFTPTSSVQAATSAQAHEVTPSAGRARVLRARALTLTHGVPLPEVKRFEDIVVTKEELQLASKEFERIFLGIN
ncbi:myb-like protein A [Rhagoletis pomonella]|uniref:myb-like protein A n=1 Tax=Rhagoletis pomonella TaxID=28610 RepID=UPI001786693F|nr:myb-like protein A [Rhagoletis pomonella]